MDNINKRLKRIQRAASKKARIGDLRYNSKRSLYVSSYEYKLIDEDKRTAIKKAFFTELDYREKKKTDRYDWQKIFFYQTKEGRLAYVNRKHVPKLIKEGKIVDRVATDIIPYGMVTKHRRVIEHFICPGKRSLLPSVRQELEFMFDVQLPCKMIIDKKFDIAYEPEYEGCFVTDGDAATDNSCMSCRGDEAQQFYGNIDGCYVARFETEDGEQVGRCIVYEYKGQRHFIRVYAKPLYQRTALNLIKEEMKENDLFGRDKKIEGLSLKADWDDDTPNMYLDGSNYGVSHTSDGWFVTTAYDYDCKSTRSGTLADEFEEYDAICEHCGRRVYDTDDGYWIDDYYYCCSSCAEADGYRECENCGDWIHEDEAIITSDDKIFCCERCAERHSYYKCYECGRWHYEDDFRSSEDGKISMCVKCLETHPKYCLNDDGHIVERQQQMELNKEKDDE